MYNCKEKGLTFYQFPFRFCSNLMRKCCIELIRQIFFFFFFIHIADDLTNYYFMFINRKLFLFQNSFLNYLPLTASFKQPFSYSLSITRSVFLHLTIEKYPFHCRFWLAFFNLELFHSCFIFLVHFRYAKGVTFQESKSSF